MATIAATAETVEEQPRTNSKKREVTAVVVSTFVTVALGLVASAAVNKVAERVKTAIAPEPEKKTEDE